MFFLYFVKWFSIFPSLKVQVPIIVVVQLSTRFTNGNQNENGFSFSLSYSYYLTLTTTTKKHLEREILILILEREIILVLEREESMGTSSCLKIIVCGSDTPDNDDAHSPQVLSSFLFSITFISTIFSKKLWFCWWICQKLHLHLVFLFFFLR